MATLSIEAIHRNGLAGVTLDSITPEFAVHAWLILFMTGVGFLKAGGALAHLNSRLVGSLELLGGLIFLPAWPDVSR